jgi:SSS family solute:Na+ symporter
MSLFPLAVVVILFLGVTAWLGYRGYKKTNTAADYLLAGRNSHPLVMALSYGATFISTSAIVGFGGIASVYGLSMLWMVVVNILIGIFIAFVFFGKRTRRMGLLLDAHTFPEFLGRRLNSKFVQVAGGSLILLAMPLYTAAVLIGGARIMEGLMGMDYNLSVILLTVIVGAYVIMGGLKGVMYTDALQGLLMFGGMLTLMIFAIAKAGGLGAAHAKLAEMSALIPEAVQKGGIVGWTQLPRTGSPIWWTLFSSLVLGVGIGVLAQPQLVVRFMTVKSDRELNQGVLIGAIFIVVAVGAGYIIGPLSNIYFFEKFGQISLAHVGGNFDKVIPAFIAEAMPSWFIYVFVLVILSAAMSTLSSQFHAIGTAAGRDIWETLKSLKPGDRKEKPAGSSLISRLGIVLGLIATAWLAFKLGEGIIARATAIFFGLMASTFLAPYIGSLYWKRLTTRGAIAGILGGLACSLFCFLFLHEKEAAFFGLCKLLTGNKTLLSGGWAFVDPLVFSLPVSLLFTMVVSLLTKQENPKLVEDCFTAGSAKGVR